MKSKTLTIFFALAILTLTILPIISAYNGFGGFGRFSFYEGPVGFLENPWVMFIIIFAILFGIMFYVLNKSFKNKAIASIIAIALSVFISMAIAQRGLLYEYGGGELSSWGLVIASLIAIAFLIRFTNESFGKIGLITTVLIVWLIFRNMDPYNILPQSLLNSGFFGIYEFLFLGASGIVTLIIFIIMAFALGGEGPTTVGGELGDLFGRRTRGRR